MTAVPFSFAPLRTSTNVSASLPLWGRARTWSSLASTRISTVSGVSDAVGATRANSSRRSSGFSTIPTTDHVRSPSSRVSPTSTPYVSDSSSVTAISSSVDG